MYAPPAAGINTKINTGLGNGEDKMLHQTLFFGI